MDQSELQKPGSKKRRLILVALFFLVTSVGIVVYLLVNEGPPNMASPDVTSTDTCGNFMVQNCESMDTGHSQSIPQKKKLSGSGRKIPDLQQEINLLNLDNAIPFTSVFADGKTTPIRFTDYFYKTKTGYRINLKNASFLSTPTYFDSCLYISGGFNSKAFYAFNANTGQLIWAVALSDDGPSSAVIIDSLLIFNTESCTIFALNRLTGKQVWAKWLGDPLLTHPVTDGHCVYTTYPSLTIHSEPGKTKSLNLLKPSHAFVCLDAKTGEIQWQRWLNGDVMTTPVLANNDIYVTTFSGTLYQLSKSDGKIMKASDLNLTSLPAVAKDRIYSTQRRFVKGEVCEAIIEIDKTSLKTLKTLAIYKAPYLDARIQEKTKLRQTSKALDALNGFAVTPEICGWKKASQIIGQSNVSSLQNYVGSTIILDGTNLYTTMGNAMYCIDIPSGNTLWSYSIKGDLLEQGGHLATIPMLTFNSIVTVTLKGEIIILDKLSGKVEKTFQTNSEVRNQPIMVRGKIYVSSTRGTLTCVDTKDNSLDGWNMFLKNNAHNCSIR